ncbi:bacteriohemerythrin [Desulfurivibrio dismutans]|uniref:bacteriohemerythrin n=1 Tax=Desulfurivibrio dismutans TaxID=1398908 RepID=UPI0023DAF8F9|nr:bacteriohemerythrin [Desulfurivibrio alkaliphilus]MDF1613595.1 bacteriohemerythrin [Desulfurivibrio alkaliphilus]
MAMFEWKDEYSVNIREIDEQHRQLVAMINELHEAMMQQRAKDVLGGLLNKLVSYCANHFAVEERLMQTHGYPEYASHKAKHEKMTAKVMALQNDLKSGKVNLTVEVSQFLKDWLDKHILGTDKKYAAHLNSKGVN